MTLGINTDVATIIAQLAAAKTQSSITTSIQQLSTGLGINSAQDDPAGLAIASGMSSQLGGLDQSALNASFGISLAQTAGDALSQATTALQSARDLAVEAANPSSTSTDRLALDSQAQQLIQQVQSIATQTQFNGQNILDGSFGTAQFQVGANAGQTVSATTGNIQTSALGGYSATGATVPGNALSAGSLVLNGVSVPATADGQASTISAAVNSVSDQTNVTATAATSVTGGVATANAATSATDIQINGVYIPAVTGGTSGSSEAAQVANSINQVESSTGVTATVTPLNQITLSNNTGADIVVTSTANGATASGLTSGNAAGAITLDSPASFSIAGSLPTAAGLTATSSSGTLQPLDSVSLQTSAGANQAITTIDGALAQINGLQASVGAVETHFQAAVSTAQSSAQNLTSALSGVQDTDFAAASANLSKQRILEQASVAMLAQANAHPQQVLALLKTA